MKNYLVTGGLLSLVQSYNNRSYATNVSQIYIKPEDDYAKELEWSHFNVVFTVILCEPKLSEALITLLFELMSVSNQRHILVKAMWS